MGPASDRLSRFAMGRQGLDSTGQHWTALEPDRPRVDGERKWRWRMEMEMGDGVGGDADAEARYVIRMYTTYSVHCIHSPGPCSVFRRGPPTAPGQLLIDP